MSTLWTPEELPSRRDFVKLSTAAAVGTGLITSLGLARSAHAAGDDTIRIGLVGCGGRGTGAAAQALQGDKNVKLVAVGDAFEDRLQSCLKGLEKQSEKEEKLKGKIDVPAERRFVGFDAYKQVLASGVDLVILATPPGFRPTHFAAAVAAGKNVFMEKPVAVDPAGVRLVLEATKQAKQKNLAVGVGLQRRHQFNYLETVKRLQDGAIGDLTSLRVYWNGAGVWVKPRQDGQTDMEYQMRNWYYFNWLSGDHITEQHIHNLDVGCWVKGQWPVKAQGMGGRQWRTGPEYGEIYDHHAVEYEFADGSRMFSYCRHTPKCWDSVTEHAQGTKGTADISGSTIKVAGSNDAWKYRGDKNNAYQTEHDDLFASIRSGNPLNEGEYGAYSSLVAIMGRMCTYSGKMLTWEQVLNAPVNLMPKELSWTAPPPVPHIAIPGQTDVLLSSLEKKQG
jgi:predicted dehydrogenase